MSNEIVDRVDILGVTVSVMGMDGVVEQVKRWWSGGGKMRVVLTPNTEQIVLAYDQVKNQKSKIKSTNQKVKVGNDVIPDCLAHNNRQAVEDDKLALESLASLSSEGEKRRERSAKQELTLMECFHKSDLNVCDSAGLVWADKVLSRRAGRGQQLKERVAGVDVMEKLVVEAAKDGKNVFLLGGRGLTAEKAAKNLKDRFRNNVDGFVGSENVSEETGDEFAKTLKRIKQHKTDLLLVGFGAPQQEQWVMKHRDDLERVGVKVVMVVGQGIDVMAGVVMRAPESWQRMGIEWLWRLLHQPWRWRRQLRLVRFVGMVSLASLR